jgi:hypothetical protein
VCIAFPPSLNKYKLHVKATCCHNILSEYIFSTNKWYLIFLWYTSTYMFPSIDPIQFYKKKSLQINLNVVQIFVCNLFNYLIT